MQKIKTLFIFTFMVVILFGAYHVIYQRPDTPPPEVAKELDNLPDALELDLGTEVSAQDLLDELNEDSGLAEEDSLATAADNGQFESPAAGQLAEGTLAESTENSIEPAAEAPSTEQAASNLEMDNPLTDTCLLYTSPSPRDKRQSRMPSSA